MCHILFAYVWILCFACCLFNDLIDFALHCAKEDELFLLNFILFFVFSSLLMLKTWIFLDLQQNT